MLSILYVVEGIGQLLIRSAKRVSNLRESLTLLRHCAMFWLMKFHYYQETDSLYIELANRSSVDSKEVAPNVVLDFDAEGNLVGIDMDHASRLCAAKFHFISLCTPTA